MRAGGSRTFARRRLLLVSGRTGDGGDAGKGHSGQNSQTARNGLW